MKGWQVHEFSEPADVLTFGDVDTREPGHGQVVVRVSRTACGFPGVLVHHGRYQRLGLPFPPGREIPGGVVASAGPGLRPPCDAAPAVSTASRPTNCSTAESSPGPSPESLPSIPPGGLLPTRSAMS
jgi:NADPH:quinone reductase-like Zn-dependent oxidoreductase